MKKSDRKANYKATRSLATDGMVLLKNEGGALPLLPTDRVGVIGNGSFDITRGGGGSAHVNCEYVSTLRDGLLEKQSEGKVCFIDESAALFESGVLSTEQLDLVGKMCDKVIVTLKRDSTEGGDREIGSDSKSECGQGDESGLQPINQHYETSFTLTSAERSFFEAVERSAIKQVVVVLNVAGICDLRFLNEFSKIKAALLAFLPGMEGGRAIIDVLCGDVNPSGKLADTVACSYDDYPSAANFNQDELETHYTEGIFVGYRYFETFAKDKVLYPFGFGLSYTEYAYENCALSRSDDVVTASADVRNVGSRAGREAVQVYVGAPAGKLEKCSVELKGYSKTEVIEPNSSAHVEVSFPVADMASFDESGATGHKGAYVLEAGDYTVYVGKNARELFVCGKIHIDKTRVVKQLAVRFDGSAYKLGESEFDNSEPVERGLTLFDVSDGKADINDFVNQLSVDELISIAQGQPATFDLGTAGIGNLPERGVVNAQTADGPAGVRRSIHTTCFPCSTLIACTWDDKLQRKMGETMGDECLISDVDVLLAPGLNIHRNPLCGRNFEYLSEDPYLAGRTASNIINGMQSRGICACAKHFAANNRENNRLNNNSIIGERALREIYLRAFEKVVKDSNPAYIMTAYNLLNGTHASSNTQLLRGILRDEWGYKGAVMSDWGTYDSLTEEVLGGNNLKMPCGNPDDAEKLKTALKTGEVSLAMLRENAKWVLLSIMKTQMHRSKSLELARKIDQDSSL